jgi:hypothetical protein
MNAALLALYQWMESTAAKAPNANSANIGGNS